MDRRLPLGYGQLQDSRANAESQALRRELIPDDNGWLISSLGEIGFAHIDVTGVALTQDLFVLYYLPSRQANVTVSQARLTCANGVAATSVETALFTYSNQVFKRIPNTLAIFTTTATGQKTYSLEKTTIPTEARLFLGIVGHGGTAVIEGFQSGASVSPQIVASRSVSGVPAMGTLYDLASTAKVTSNIDFPMVAYFSQEASQII